MARALLYGAILFDHRKPSQFILSRFTGMYAYCANVALASSLEKDTKHDDPSPPPIIGDLWRKPIPLGLTPQFQHEFCDESLQIR